MGGMDKLVCPCPLFCWVTRRKSSAMMLRFVIETLSGNTVASLQIEVIWIEATVLP